MKEEEKLNTNLFFEIVFLFFKHYYSSPVTEKIVYFVIYILELSLHLVSANVEFLYVKIK